MNKTLLIILIALVVVAGGFSVFNGYIYNEKRGEQAPILGFEDAVYDIDGRIVRLAGGVSEIDITPGSALKIITRYFGNEVRHDFNNDGREDVAFLLTQEAGGSGMFYYIVAALNTENGYTGSHGFFLGDRIAPQTTGMSQDPDQGNVVVVNYADRAEGESFSVSPSIGKSVRLIFNSETKQFSEVVDGDFETSGIVKGSVSIGPLCPVEREGFSCGPDDVYLSRTIVMTPKGGGRPVDAHFYIQLNADGTFEERIPEGEYEVTLTDCGFMGCQYELPKTVRVLANQMLLLTIDIDTGIR